MRFRYLLPAVLLTAGSAMAQAGAAIPNAIGVWNSRAFGFIAWYIGTGYGPGSAGNTMWQALPPEYTTYFRNTGSRPRELDYRGCEFTLAYGFFATHATYETPRIQVRAAKPNPAQLQRWIPDNAILPYVDVASVAGGITGNLGAGTVIRVSNMLNTAVAIPTDTNAINPNGGNAVMWVWQDFSKEYGDGGIFVVGGTSEPTAGGIQSVSYSGGSLVSGQNFILPNVPQSGEYCVTTFWEQSMIQMVKNTKLISGTGLLIGGSPPPGQPFSFWALDQDDGRGAVYANAGDAVSYSGNSSYGGGSGSHWFAPFVLFSGDVAGPPFDPNPELWDSVGPNYIYKLKVSTWIDDFCAITGACPPGTGAIISPQGANWGLWMGLDLANNLANFTVLVNGIAFADINSVQWSGPLTTAYNSNTNPGGLFGRNLANVAGYFGAGGAANPITGVMEHRTLLIGPQTGYTPLAGGADLGGGGGATGPYGFGIYNGGLAGTTFAVQCWVLDLGTNQIVDMTNVAETHLQ